MGEILNTAGVGGLLIALLFVGATAIFVMECLSELVVLWPVPNALVEYVKKFVDEDLSTVVGIGYWYRRFYIFLLVFTATDSVLQVHMVLHFYGPAHRCIRLLLRVSPCTATARDNICGHCVLTLGNKRPRC